MNRETRKVIAARVIALLWGGALLSCDLLTLEPSVDSPGNKEAPGTTEGLTVYEPQITYDGTTLIVTYTIRAKETVTTLQLDTALIQEELWKRIGVSEKSTDGAPPLVWIEDSPGIVLSETSEGTWKNGAYEGPYENGRGVIRINGLSYAPPSDESSEEGGTVEIACDIDKFDDNGVDRLAPALAVNTEKNKYSSAANFYAGATVTEEIKKGIAEQQPLRDADSTKKWVEQNAPLLRVVYQWAE
jgi:hypothetical protein